MSAVVAGTSILAALAGEWVGEEIIATTRWGDGGVAKAHIDARLELGARILAMDYQEERDGQLALQAHAVFTTGPEHDQLALYWFDSFGFVPSAPAVGIRHDERLTFVRNSLRGQTRHIYTLCEEGLFTLTLESSFDGGVSWTHVLDGTYRRIKRFD